MSAWIGSEIGSQGRKCFFQLQVRRLSSQAVVIGGADGSSGSMFGFDLIIRLISTPVFPICSPASTSTSAAETKTVRTQDPTPTTVASEFDTQRHSSYCSLTSRSSHCPRQYPTYPLHLCRIVSVSVSVQEGKITGR
jgi:hypothetical protein